MNNNVLTVLAESAELAGSIDAARALAAKERAEKRLAAHDASLDEARAEARPATSAGAFASGSIALIPAAYLPIHVIHRGSLSPLFCGHRPHSRMRVARHGLMSSSDVDQGAAHQLGQQFIRGAIQSRGTLQGSRKVQGQHALGVELASAAPSVPRRTHAG